mmetsp:Transcript_35679/g.93617  ORF Transcript_35679/g.93617 Transcript_35679/m.93617 type:complete len:111 (-) Transcript_35679:13-345(-)
MKTSTFSCKSKGLAQNTEIRSEKRKALHRQRKPKKPVPDVSQLRAAAPVIDIPIPPRAPEPKIVEKPKEEAPKKPLVADNFKTYMQAAAAFALAGGASFVIERALRGDAS